MITQYDEAHGDDVQREDAHVHDARHDEARKHGTQRVSVCTLTNLVRPKSRSVFLSVSTNGAGQRSSLNDVTAAMVNDVESADGRNSL